MVAGVTRSTDVIRQRSQQQPFMEHGGNVAAAAQRFGRKVSDWVDLSTGISPLSWPVPAIPENVWRALPCGDGALESAAAQRYGCAQEAVLAVPGSQYALQSVPSHLPVGRVAVPACGYAEHRAAFARAGHTLVRYRDTEALQTLVAQGAVKHALLINPNNPTTDVVSPQVIDGLHATLCRTGGTLLVDEAFMDATPEASCSTLAPAQGLIVYRSLGKFYGLAGLRLGFVLATPEVCAQIAHDMPPWAVSHPARWIGSQALVDDVWHRAHTQQLRESMAAWNACLVRCLADTPVTRIRSSALFVSAWAPAAWCEAMYTALAERGVLIRLFSGEDATGEQDQGILRFGLPKAHELSTLASLLTAAIDELDSES